MSFSFTAAGKPGEVIAKVGHQAANSEQFPQAFADAINGQLSALPDTVHVNLACNGHTGWAEGQTSGHINMNAQMQIEPFDPGAAQPAS
jgi:hypothetical protein